MTNPAFHDDDEDQTVIPVAFDDKTLARLLEICDEGKIHPSVLVASLIHDVLEDDAMAHDQEPADVIRPSSNRDLN